MIEHDHVTKMIEHDHYLSGYDKSIYKSFAQLFHGNVQATRPSAATEPAGPVQPKSDFCLPMQQIQRAKMCPLFQSKCGAPEPQRCMVSLWSDDIWWHCWILLTYEVNSHWSDAQQGSKLKWNLTAAEIVCLRLTNLMDVYGD